MVKKIVLISIFLLILLCLSLLPNTNGVSVHAQADTNVYSIYDKNFQLLFQKDDVSIGDGYLSDDFNYYEVDYLDKENYIGIAKFIRKVEKPKVDFSSFARPIKIERRVICLYTTHNDESYVPSDGVSSVYGNGGIKDVALALKNELSEHFVDVYFDDTLHIPHDNSAYTRSLKTAKQLLNTYEPDAIFDIHRDATSRSFYVKNVSGKERGRVRIVVGKANPNMKQNEEFALYLMAIADELYPWLFTDIFYASGHYNQGLDNKALLFECGSHLVEKELEIETMNELADVVTTALYHTTVNEGTGDLTINGVENKENPTINELFDKKEKSRSNVLIVSILSVVFATISAYAIVFLYRNYKAQKSKK